MDGRDPDPSSSADGAFLSASDGQTSTQDSSSPISQLPPEVLSVLLTFAMPRKRVAHKLPYEVTLSHVSKFWRNVVLGMPLLWTKVNIYSSQSVDCAQTYIQRSGHQPLDVNIDFYRADKTQTPQANKNVVTIVLRAIHRVRSINILCYHQKTAALMEECFTTESAPLLESFTVRHGTAFSAVNSMSTSKAFVFDQGTPRLTTFISDTPNFLPRVHQLRNITTLYWHGLDSRLQITATDFQHTLANLTSLVNLSVQGTVGFGFWPTGMPVAPKVVLGNLKALRCLDGGGLAMHTLLLISAPKLESIWFECSLDNFHAHFFNAPQMNVPGRPKFPALRYLTLHWQVDLSTTESFARVFPNVTHVHCFHISFRNSEKLVQTMTNRWRAVKTLIFTRFRERDADKLTTALSQIVLTRTLGVSPMSGVLLDEDHMHFLQKAHTNAANDVLRIAKVLSRDNYAEHWWNTFEKEANA